MLFVFVHGHFFAEIMRAKHPGSASRANDRAYVIDIDFHVAFFHDENYHKSFTDALRDYTEMDYIKYAYYNNKI